MITSSSTLKELGAFLDANKLTMAIEHATIWGVFLYCNGRQFSGVDSDFGRALTAALVSYGRR